jgi:hypothetical protein
LSIRFYCGTGLRMRQGFAEKFTFPDWDTPFLSALWY